MGKHEKPSSNQVPTTVSDDTWTRVTSTEAWETTPAADSSHKTGLN